VNYLLDTNVVSEPTKRQPNVRVLRWYEAQQAEADKLFISVLTLGELRRGILLLDEGPRRRALFRWLEAEVETVFEGRVLNIDGAVMREWAGLQNHCQRQGRLLPAMDGLIAATAQAHGLILATRNIADFSATGVALVNPWDA
jgi:predicted nucleic acid-binding protein